MAKVIIGIHGLGNKPPKQLLEQWWKDAIDEGLLRIGKSFSNYRFELVYWSDILHEKPLDINCTDKENPFYLGEKYTPATGRFLPEDHATRKRILDFLSREFDSIFLNKDFTLNYSFVTDSIIRHWFRDLEIYYDSDKMESNLYHAKERIRKRLTTVLKKYRYDEILIIGHSMGSIIAYDVLSFEVPHLTIDTFITIGSPLGVPVVKSKIAAERKLNHRNTVHLTTPKNIQHKWYNFSDLEDRVAFNYRLADDFGANRKLVKPQDYIVNNDYEIDGKRNPHKSYGYLRTKEFALKVAEFLEYRKPLTINDIWKKLHQWKNNFIQLSQKDHNLRNQ